MHWQRVSAIILQAWYHLRHSRETWMDIFWFPLINALVIGVLSLYFARQGNVSSYLPVLLVGLLFWHVVEIGSYSIAVGVLWEIWSRSFSTLFVSPLTLSEFVMGHIIFSLCKQVLLLTLLSIVVFTLFHFSLLSLGWLLPIYVFLLALYGWAFGMFVFGLILRLGSNIQSLAWGLVYIVQPIIGVYYPISMLPPWLQTIARFIGPTYVLESARSTIATGTVQWEYISRALIFDAVALLLSYLFMKYMWEWARKSGALARMEL